jgi:predicted RNase H-like HicB family nuclease
MFKHVSGGQVNAEVIDFPGAITCGRSVDKARQLLAGALEDVAASLLQEGRPLPQPDPAAHVEDADLEEPIYLLLSAVSSFSQVPNDARATAA